MEVKERGNLNEETAQGFVEVFAVYISGYRKLSDKATA
jgi:hypothetical protein